MGLDTINSNENVYNGRKDIKYIFYEEESSNKLIVTFPGFSSKDKPPAYEHINTLNECKCHKLFILDDYGPRGSYLMGENRDHSIEESVVSLIFSLCEKHGIKKENIISQGNSKGGYCALYFGIKYNFGSVIAGIPQTCLGNYLLKVIPEVAEYIAGGNDEEDRIYLNSLLYSQVDISKKFPEIYIHAGEGDHYYPEHVIPFLEKLDNKGIKYELDLRNYSSHTSIGLYYPGYLLKTLSTIDDSIIKLEPPILKTNIKSEDGFLELSCSATGDNLGYAFYIFRNYELIEKIFYQKQSHYKYPINSTGIYGARIYVKDKSNVNSTFTDEIVITDYDDSLESIQDYKKFRSTEHGEKFDIDIHGSCVSRDIFNFDDKNEVALGKYFARHSFISAVSKPFPEKIELDIPSRWQKRTVEIDLRKELFKELSANYANYILIDFIDERSRLMKYKNSIITVSMELQNSNFENDFEGDYISKFNLDKKFWKRHMDVYVENLLKIYDEQQIIIHETYFVDSYIDKNGEVKSFPQKQLDFNHVINALIKEYYEYIKTKLPDAHVINIIEDYNLAYENHRWGLSPVHYEDEYYRHMLRILKRILDK